ncbi:hypothetical protein XFF7766_280046 [Xanthomonas citri pv. fuscans]|nr:hypothetical protein XFF7766_280046 [Xanthomonas citri pv. fuscans]
MKIEGFQDRKSSKKLLKTSSNNNLKKRAFCCGYVDNHLHMYLMPSLQAHLQTRRGPRQAPTLRIRP